MSSRSVDSKTIDLPEAELELLACLARLEQATARELRDALHESRPMAHGSVLTLLGRLEQKGMVSKEKAPVGKAFVYRPAVDPQPTFRGVTRNLARRVFGGDSVALVASLFESRPPDQQELTRLRELVAALESDADGPSEADQEEMS